MNAAYTGTQSANPRPDATLPISVVICTHNRADHLINAIRSVLEQNMSSREYETIVVDNGSTDNTVEVVGSFRSAENVRYLFEKKLGLCQARNTGWQSPIRRCSVRGR
jgi:glycosyltransferase involved in cell wall biosynthesis